MPSLSVVLFGDMQQQNEITQNIIQVARSLQPDLCIVLGDLVNNATDLAQWERCNKLLAPLLAQCELHAIPGNHDYEQPGIANHFAKHFATPHALPYTAFSRCGNRFILLDTMLYDQTMERGLFTDDTPQYTWLEAELAKAQEQGEAAFVCGHHPIFMSPELYFSTSPSIRVDTTRAAVEPSPLLHALLAGKARMYFSGHIHLYDHSRFKGLPCITSGATSYDFPEVSDGRNPYSELCVKKHHLCHLELADGKLIFTALDQFATAFDTWQEPLLPLPS